MINRDDVRHGAILKPQLTKQRQKRRKPRGNYCPYFKRNAEHAFARTKEGYDQCVECGKIKG